ncbi:MAG: PQQ-binding-like beta-propeller repeat protein [bacterium]
MRLLITLFLVGALVGIVHAADPTPVDAPAATPTAPAWVGVRGPEGSGIYPDSKPPTTWNLKTGKNVRWVLPLNGWGQGQPVVGGDRVFLLLEADALHDFPRLQCLDIATGAVLWENVIDHLPIAEPDETKRTELYAQWKKYNQMLADGAKFEAEFMAAHKIGKPEKQAVIDHWKQMGYVPIWRLNEATAEDGGNEPSRLRLFLPKPEMSKMMKLLAKYGYWEDIYQSTCNFACIGLAYGAPIWSEKEKAVYIATAGGTSAKYDQDGKLLWMTWSFNPGKTNLNGSGTDTSARSPIISGDLFINTAANNLVAVDRATGKIRFKDTLTSGSISAPAVMKINGKEILLTAGPRAFLLPDGKPLKLDGWLISGMQALVKHDERDVVFFCGSGEHCSWPNKGFGIDTPPPAAVRFTLEGDTLHGKVLWSGVQAPEYIDKLKVGGNAPWLLYNDGKLYHRNGAILDALTGKIITGKLVNDKDIQPSRDRAIPVTSHLLQLAGGNVYGWRENGTAQVYTADGKPVSNNRFERPILTKEQMPIWHGIDSSDGYGNNISYSCQFTFGKDCIVMRGLMHLYCFSDGAQLPLAPVPAVIAATKE